MNAYKQVFDNLVNLEKNIGRKLSPLEFNYIRYMEVEGDPATYFVRNEVYDDKRLNLKNIYRKYQEIKQTQEPKTSNAN